LFVTSLAMFEKRGSSIVGDYQALDFGCSCAHSSSSSYPVCPSGTDFRGWCQSGYCTYKTGKVTNYGINECNYHMITCHYYEDPYNGRYSSCYGELSYYDNGHVQMPEVHFGIMVGSLTLVYIFFSVIVMMVTVSCAEKARHSVPINEPVQVEIAENPIFARTAHEPATSELPLDELSRGLAMH
jgi:hypothetical protein